MSRKSRQRKSQAAAGPGADPAQAGAPVATATVETTRQGVPFGVVVLFAAVMSVPTILQMAEETLSFDAGITRLLVALAVAWLLSNLVYAVIDGMRPAAEHVEVELEAPAAPRYEPPAEPTMPYATPLQDDDPDLRATGS